MNVRKDSTTDSNRIEYLEKIVAFLDILGFRNLVLQGQDQAKSIIQKLDETLTHTLKCIAENGEPDWISVKLFSDCFCISCHKDDLPLMLSELSFLQYYLAKEGIFVGGGLSFGSHYENERIIFSEGLIRAYDLQHLDPYPRVLIDHSLVERSLPLPNSYKEELLSFVMKGQDGLFFLDYLQCVVEADVYTGTLDEFMEEHKRAILEQVSLNRSNPSVLDKYLWLAAYHNFKFAENFTDDEWEADYWAELQDRILIPSSAFPSFAKIDI